MLDLNRLPGCELSSPAEDERLSTGPVLEVHTSGAQGIGEKVSGESKDGRPKDNTRGRKMSEVGGCHLSFTVICDIMSRP